MTTGVNLPPITGTATRHFDGRHHRPMNDLGIPEPQATRLRTALHGRYGAGRGWRIDGYPYHPGNAVPGVYFTDLTAGDGRRRRIVVGAGRDGAVVTTWGARTGPGDTRTIRALFDALRADLEAAAAEVGATVVVTTTPARVVLAGTVDVVTATADRFKAIVESYQFVCHDSTIPGCVRPHPDIDLALAFAPKTSPAPDTNTDRIML